MSWIKRHIKTFLAAIADLVFVGNHFICDWVYGNDLISWWKLRLNIYAANFALVLIVASMKGEEKLTKFFLSLGFGLAISDAIDRIWFDTNQFTNSDIFMILATFSIVYYTVFLKDKFNGRIRTRG